MCRHVGKVPALLIFFIDICMLRHLIVSVPRLVRSHALSINVMAAIRLTAGRASNTTQFMCVLVNKTVA